MAYQVSSGSVRFGLYSNVNLFERILLLLLNDFNVKILMKRNIKVCNC